jgi:hypothetical protein
MAVLVSVVVTGAGVARADQPPAGQPWYWGANSDDQFGDAAFGYSSFLPLPGPSLGPLRPTMISGDYRCTLAVTSDSRVIAWVDNPTGPAATVVQGLNNIVGVSEDDGCCCAWDAERHAWLWSTVSWYWGISSPWEVTDSGQNILKGVVSAWVGEAPSFMDYPLDGVTCMGCVFTLSNGQV